VTALLDEVRAVEEAVPPAMPAPTRRRAVALWAGVTLVTVWVVVAVAWPALVPVDPRHVDLTHRLAAPSGSHLLGTDQFGRDTFARMLAGARPVLLVAPLATALAVITGTALGLIAGASRGWVDSLIMRTLDVFTVFPAIIASVLFVALLGRSTPVLVVVIALAFVPIVTRSVRAATVVESSLPYVDAARLRGERRWSLLGSEIGPNVSRTVLVEATSRLGDAVFAAATLSFVGLGQPPGSPDWGTSVSDNRAWLAQAPWTVLAPSLAIASLVVGVALVGDGLRQRWDAS
jgi:peptide/nickel transport system permease protein